MNESGAEVVRRSYAAWDAQDERSLVGLYTRDCEWHVGSVAFPEQVYRGHDGLRALMRETASVFTDVRSQFELRESDGRILVRASMEGTSKTGARASFRFGQVVSLDHGRIQRVEHTDDPPPSWDTARPVR